MATATKTKLRNFIGGKSVDPAEGGTEDVVNPATGEAIAAAPLSTKADVDARGRGGARAPSRAGRRRRRANARGRCCGSPT